MTYEQLVKKVEELEKQLKEKTTKEEVYRDLRKNLGSYDDRFKTEKTITLKNNAYVKNRKGIFDWTGNVLALGFNNTDPSKLNQIQIGLDRDENTRESIRETSTLFLVAKRNDRAMLGGEGDAVKASNGLISLMSERTNGERGGLQIGERGAIIKDKEGTAAYIFGSETNGLSGIGNVIDMGGNKLVAICLHTEKDIASGGLYQQHIKQYVDILPMTTTTTPSLGRRGFAYRELVLRSPDGSSFAVRVANNGALSATKL